MINPSFLHQLDKFSLIVKKRVTSNYAGDRVAKAVGQGLVFADYARYSIGDDFRAIDWKVYGKTDKLYIKRYEEERNLTVHVVVDFSASMNFGKKIKKSDYAGMIGLGYAYIALKNNEKFVLSTFSNQLDVFRAQRGVRQVASILKYLNDKKPKGKTQFQDSLLNYKKLLHSKSYVVFISDFFYDIEEIRNVLYRYKKHKVVLVQILDPIEKNLEYEGDYDLVDLETQEEMKTVLDPYAKKEYHDKLTMHNAAIIDVCNDIGAQFFSVSTSTPIFDTFYDILNAR